MNSSQTLYFVLTNFVRILPQFLAIIGGIIWCIYNRRKSPSASNFALIGLIILLITHFLELGFTAVITNLPIWTGIPYTSIGYVSLGGGFLLSAFAALGFLLIVSAVWKQREIRNR